MTQVDKFFGYLWTCTTIIILFALERTGSTVSTEYSEGHGTVHEEMGQAHVPNVIYTDYKSKVNNSEPVNFRSWGLTPVYAFAGFFFQIIANDTGLDGYASLVNGSTLALGQKATENDWKDLLAENKVLIPIVLFFIVLIFVMPFIAVVYCCFCCCLCKKSLCPPCADAAHASKRLWCSILLILLIIGLLIGLIIAFLANKLINRGAQSMEHRQRNTAKEFCAYRKDVSDHINHLLVFNYNEIKDHAIEQSADGYKHLLLDLSDTSGGNALTDLERILNNMEEASFHMKQLDRLQARLRFIAATLRDAYRGYKRNMIRCLNTYCNLQQCRSALSSGGLLSWDTSTCLHLDNLPNTTAFWEAMDESVDEKLHEIPVKGVQRLAEIGNMLMEATAPILPPLKEKLEKGGMAMLEQKYYILKTINSTIKNLYSGSYGTSRSFYYIYNRFGYDRDKTNIAVCLLLILIITFLIIGVVWGLCLRINNLGYIALLIAIILIFCVISFITLVGLFHFIIGLITYLSACKGDNASSDFHSMPKNLEGCGKTGTLFSLLQSNGKYDVNNIERIHILEEDDESTSWHEFKDDLSNVTLITQADIVRMNTVLENLFPYHSFEYTRYICKTPASPLLYKQAFDQKRITLDLLYARYGNTYETSWMSVMYETQDILAYQPIEDEFVPLVERLEGRLRQIDSLIVAGDRSFNQTFQPLIESIVRSQDFIKSQGLTFINSLGKNLTDSIEELLVKYINMVVAECTYKVGNCRKLGLIYNRDIVFLCQSLIHPINAFWVGTLLCALLLIPTLFVAHYLLCLYRVSKVYVAPVLLLTRDANPCPTCTGSPPVPRPIVICSGGQQTVSNRDVDQVESSMSMQKRKRE